MSKTVPISDEAHRLVVEKQREIYEKYRVTVKISDLLTAIVKHSVSKSEEFLGFKPSYLNSIESIQTANIKDSEGRGA